MHAIMNSTNHVHPTRRFPVYSWGLVVAVNVAGIVGNILLIISHKKDPLKILKSSSSLLITSIALLDLLISSVLLMMVSFALSACNPETIVYVHLITNVLVGLFHIVSFTLYLLLAVERFCSVAFPLWHRVNVTTRVCRYWVVAIWLVYTVLDVGFNTILIKDKKVNVQSHLAHVLYMWLMFLLIQCTYIASYVSIRKQNLDLQKRQDLSEATVRTTKIRLKMEYNFLRTIAIVCFLLAATVLAFLTMAFMYVFAATEKSEKNYNQSLPSYYLWGVLGISVNSAINVFIYIWRLLKYRKTFRKLYCNR